MKNMILILATLLSLAGCREDRPEIKQKTGQETTIYGTWQLTSAYSDPGDGSGGWRDVEDGDIYQIYSDHTFIVFNRYKDPSISQEVHDKWSTGTISLTHEEIIFYYDASECVDRENPACGLGYPYYFEDEFTLVLEARCDVECFNIFTKITGICGTPSPS